MERLLLLVLRDYVHWRRNYFPSDSLLLNESLRREYSPQRDALQEETQRLLALLRRNFPFYSPRYLAHELSDTLMPAAVGYIAGLLYNPNNVTPEAAPVTVDLEVEACSAFLRMLGFREPPAPPEPGVDLDRYYSEESARGFAWCHLSPGGTLSNAEALWVARDVKYFPFALRDVCRRLGLAVEAKLPSGKRSEQISTLDDIEIASLRPNECIYLLAKYADALRRSTEHQERAQDAWNLIRESKLSTARGLGAVFEMAPPVILVASTAHYSIKKAAQVLGIGSKNVWSVPIDEQFRMRTGELRRLIKRARSKGFNPFCVIATAGSTEEGSVDPIHEIVDLRTELEEKDDFSFWIHVDAAWGGFIRTLFCPEPAEQARAVMSKASKVLNVPEPVDLLVWNSDLNHHIAETVRSILETESTNASASSVSHAESVSRIEEPAEQRGSQSAGSSRRSSASEGAVRRINAVFSSMRELLLDNQFVRYTELLESLPLQLGKEIPLGISEDALTWTFDDLFRDLVGFVSSPFSMCLDRYKRDFTVSWPMREVCAAMLRVASADSVTLDPHKMGYVPYPAGAVAFRNDRVRHFIQQEAPYITAKGQATLVHRPPIHRVEENGASRIHRDAFGPFILDGSRPGAAAAGVWLATRAVPLTRQAHGSIVRASLLAASELYHWLLHWAGMHQKLEKDIDFEFVPLTSRGPDTNLVTFTIKKRTSSGLPEMNKLTESVYREFTIESELGEMEYSYSQPFFVSRTTHRAETYSKIELQDFAARARLNRKWGADYRQEGIAVLRATVMNPYLSPLKELGKGDLIREFVSELAAVAAREVRKL